METELKIEAEEKKEVKPRVCIGHVDSKFREMFEILWNLIRPHVEAIANTTLAEYSAYHVRESIRHGFSDLWIGYIDRTCVANSANAQENFVSFMDTRKYEDIFGYVVTRYEPNSVHIWQAYVKPEFQHTNAMEQGFKFLCDTMKNYSAEYLTFSSNRQGWKDVAEKLGFQEIHTIYRMKLEK